MKITILLHDWKTRMVEAPFSPLVAFQLCNKILVPCNRLYRQKIKFPPLINHPTMRYLRDPNEEFRCTNWIWGGLSLSSEKQDPNGDCEDLGSDLASEYNIQGIDAFAWPKEVSKKTIHMLTARPANISDPWDDWIVDYMPSNHPMIPKFARDRRFVQICPSRRFGM